jgi:predicted  nucleic acid-binding Zn-ribbon protein
VSLAEKLVEELEADEKVRKRLAKILVPEAVSESELRLAIINAVLRDVATKDDVAKLRDEIEKLRVATREDIEKIRIATGEDIERIRTDTKEEFARLEERIEVLRKEMYTYITELRERISKLEGAFTQLVERIGDLDKRIDALDKRIDALDKRIDYVTKVSWALTLSVLATLVAQVLMKVLMP